MNARSAARSTPGRFLLRTALAGAAVLALAACAGSEPATSDDSSATDAGAAPADGYQPAPAPNQPAPAPSAARSQPAPAPTVKFYTLDAGTTLNVELAQDIVSDVAQVGDPVAARVKTAVASEGRVMIPEGAEVRGSVVEVKPAKRFGGQAMVSVKFDSVMLPSGEAVIVEGNLAAYAKKDTAKDAGTIAGGTAGGALLGKVLGGDKKDAAAGAIVGGAIATAVASKRGDEAFLPAGSEAAIVTREPVKVSGRL